MQDRNSLRLLIPKAHFSQNMKTFTTINVVIPELLGTHSQYINEGAVKLAAVIKFGLGCLRPHRFDLCICNILSAGRKKKEY